MLILINMSVVLIKAFKSTVLLIKRLKKTATYKSLTQFFTKKVQINVLRAKTNQKDPKDPSPDNSVNSSAPDSPPSSAD